MAAGWEEYGLDKFPTALIAPAVISANITKDHSIYCVMERLYGQVSGIEWMTDTKTDNSYNPKDGVYKDGTQTSSLTLTSENLIALSLKKVGDEHTFSCSVKLTGMANPLVTTQTVTIEGDLPDDAHDCEKTFSCTTSSATNNGQLACMFLVVFDVFINFC